MAVSAASLRYARGFSLTPLAGLTALIVAAPLLALAVLAIAGPAQSLPVRLPVYAGHTAALALIVGGGSILIGAPLAWLVTRAQFPGRGFFDWALALPLAAPGYVLAYAYVELTSGAGPLQSWIRTSTGLSYGEYPFLEVGGLWGAGFILTLALYPYVYLLARQAFAAEGRNAADAARTLGASPWGVFWRAELPLARPAIAAGAALAVMEALADYGAVVHLGAPTIAVGVLDTWKATGSAPAAARLALILLIATAALLWLERRARSRASTAWTRPRRKKPQRFALNGANAWGAFALCLTPLVLALGLPLGRLAIVAAQTTGVTDLFGPALRTLSLGIASAGIAVVLAFTAAYAARTGGRLAAFGVRFATLGYAAPGAVAAVGVMALLGWLQGGIDSVWRSAYGGLAPCFRGACSPCCSPIRPVSPLLRLAQRKAHWPRSRLIWTLQLVRLGPQRGKPPGWCMHR